MKIRFPVAASCASGFRRGNAQQPKHCFKITFGYSLNFCGSKQLNSSHKTSSFIVKSSSGENEKGKLCISFLRIDPVYPAHWQTLHLLYDRKHSRIIPTQKHAHAAHAHIHHNHAVHAECFHTAISFHKMRYCIFIIAPSIWSVNKKIAPIIKNSR